MLSPDPALVPSCPFGAGRTRTTHSIHVVGALRVYLTDDDVLCFIFYSFSDHSRSAQRLSFHMEIWYGFSFTHHFRSTPLHLPGISESYGPSVALLILAAPNKHWYLC